MNRNENIGYSNQMMSAASNCSRFTRRNDVDMFSMTDYRSCENCRHLGENSRCIVRDRPYGSGNSGGIS